MLQASGGGGFNKRAVSDSVRPYRTGRCAANEHGHIRRSAERSISWADWIGMQVGRWRAADRPAAGERRWVEVGVGTHDAAQERRGELGWSGQPYG